MTWFRVKDKRTGHHYSTQNVDPEHHQVLKQDAVDVNGNPLPAKHNTTRATQADTKAESADPKEK